MHDDKLDGLGYGPIFAIAFEFLVWACQQWMPWRSVLLNHTLPSILAIPAEVGIYFLLARSGKVYASSFLRAAIIFTLILTWADYTIVSGIVRKMEMMK